MLTLQSTLLIPFFFLSSFFVAICIYHTQAYIFQSLLFFSRFNLKIRFNLFIFYVIKEQHNTHTKKNIRFEWKNQLSFVCLKRQTENATSISKY